MGQDAQRPRHVVKVMQRLAHAHKDDVGGALAPGAAGRVALGQLSEQAVGQVHLADDLAGGQVATKAQLGRRAEVAVDGAADLRRDTLRQLAPLSRCLGPGLVLFVLIQRDQVLSSPRAGHKRLHRTRVIIGNQHRLNDAIVSGA